MTSPDRNYDDALRRAFQAMADPIEPVGDGLVRIRAQLDGPWLRRQWKLFLHECIDLVVLLWVRSQPFLSWLRDSAGNAAGVAWFLLSTFLGRVGRAIRDIPASIHRSYWAMRDRFAALSFRGSGWSFVPEAGKPAPRPEHSPAHRAPQRPRGQGVTATIGWLRPALAVASVLVVVSVGALSVPQLRAAIMSPTASDGGVSQNAGGPGGAGPGGGGADGQGQPGGVAGSSTHSPGSDEAGQTSRAGASSPAPGSTGCPTPAPAPSSSPPPSTSPSPSPSPSPSSSPSASPTPSPTDSPSPAVQNTPTPAPAAPTPTPTESATTTARVAGQSASDCPSPGASPAPTPTPSDSASPASPSSSSADADALPRSVAARHLA
ncbi:MAG TPA: hypothetical protein VGF32_14175 [Streptosporangiaceae bacterium]|jgi:hypothetical protein